jgi:hypothetical protein
VIRAEQDLPGTEGGREEEGGGQSGERTQTIYAHVSKCVKKPENCHTTFSKCRNKKAKTVDVQY